MGKEKEYKGERVEEEMKKEDKYNRVLLVTSFFFVLSLFLASIPNFIPQISTNLKAIIFVLVTLFLLYVVLFKKEFVKTFF